MLKSYLTDRHFYVKHGDEETSLHSIQAGVPQGSVMGPTLYLLYTADLPLTEGVVIGIFADDTAALAVDTCPSKASAKLQVCLDNISNWTRVWRIKTNETKSVHVSFTMRRILR